jgi:hypothetical protein
MKRGICHAERSEASAVSPSKQNKQQIPHCARDAHRQGFFSSLLGELHPLQWYSITSAIKDWTSNQAASIVQSLRED